MDYYVTQKAILAYLRSIYPKQATVKEIKANVPHKENYYLNNLFTIGEVKRVKPEGSNFYNYSYANLESRVELDTVIYSLICQEGSGVHFIDIADYFEDSEFEYTPTAYKIEQSLDRLTVDGKLYKKIIPFTHYYRYYLI